MYKGSLLNGIPKEGKSLIEYSDNDGVLYNGDFKSFKYNGKGILYYNDEYIITSKIRIKFDGIFKDNLKVNLKKINMKELVYYILKDIILNIMKVVLRKEYLNMEYYTD